MKTVGIVLSAGKGTRMNSEIPKQYLMLGEYPVIYYSLRAFQDSFLDEVILVTAEEDVEYCRTNIVERYHFTKVKKIVAGGKERYDSVYRAMQAMDEDADYVFVHDGARPLITQSLLQRLLDETIRHKACVPAIPAVDTIKVSDKDGFVIDTPDRKSLWMVQTPQVFSYDLIKEAYSRIYIEESSVPITDDAMVVETYLKHPIKLVQGEVCNRKITTPEDLIMAKYMLESMACENA